MGEDGSVRSGWRPRADRAMARLYEAWLRGSAAVLARRRLTLTAGAGLCVAVVAWIALAVLQDFPNSGDEYCYLYQSDTFAQGRLWNTPRPLQAFFDFYHVREVDGRLFSVFPPGWPAVLAAARLARFPLWLVNPLLSAASLVLLFALGRRLHGETGALAAVAVTFLSSFFLFNGASYFAHALCSVEILAYAYFGIRAIDERRVMWAALAGVAVGTALLTRNYTAVWAGLPFGLALLGKGRFGLKAVVAAMAGGAPFAAALLAYNAATMGHPFALAMGGGFEAYDTRWFPPGWVGRAIDITTGHLVKFVAWTPPALIGLYAWWWRRTPRQDWRFTDFVFPSLVVAYFIYVDRGGNQYGPRYYFEALPFIALAAVAPLFREESFAGKTPAARTAFRALALSVVAAVPLFAWHAAVESRVIWERREPYRLAARQDLDHAVVFLGTKAGLRRPMSTLDLTRNGADRTARVLFVHDLGEDNARLMRAYAGWAFYRYRMDPDLGHGVLEPVAAPPGG